jgi:hypothetical protein
VTSSELVVLEARTASLPSSLITSSKSATGTRSTIRARIGLPTLSVSVLSSVTWPPNWSTITWTSYLVSPTSLLRKATEPVLMSACCVWRATAFVTLRLVASPSPAPPPS